MSMLDNGDREALQSEFSAFRRGVNAARRAVAKGAVVPRAAQRVALDQIDDLILAITKVKKS